MPDGARGACLAAAAAAAAAARLRLRHPLPLGAQRLQLLVLLPQRHQQPAAHH